MNNKSKKITQSEIETYSVAMLDVVKGKIFYVKTCCFQQLTIIINIYNNCTPLDRRVSVFIWARLYATDYFCNLTFRYKDSYLLYLIIHSVVTMLITFTNVPLWTWKEDTKRHILVCFVFQNRFKYMHIYGKIIAWTLKQNNFNSTAKSYLICTRLTILYASRAFTKFCHTYTYYTKLIIWINYRFVNLFIV